MRQENIAVWLTTSVTVPCDAGATASLQTAAGKHLNSVHATLSCTDARPPGAQRSASQDAMRCPAADAITKLAIDD